MEILDLRQLRAHDLEPLLAEEKDVWREQLLWDYSGSADLVKRFVESRSLPGYAAFEDGRIVGYSFFVYEEHKGLIGDLFVSAPYRGVTETQLLTHVIETLSGSPGIRRIESQLMMFAAGSLDPHFFPRDFRSHLRQFMFLDLGQGPAEPLPARSLAEFDLVAWDEHLFDEAAVLITKAYRDHVDSQINDQYRSWGGASRFLRNIIHYPGCGIFHPRSSWAAFHKGRREMGGLILTSVVHPGIGHVTQVCAAPEFQGSGLGYELMRRAAECFRASAFSGLSLTVTGANHRAVRLYERMGFGVLKEFSAYVWNSAAG